MWKKWFLRIFLCLKLFYGKWKLNFPTVGKMMKAIREQFYIQFHWIRQRRRHKTNFVLFCGSVVIRNICWQGCKYAFDGLESCCDKALNENNANSTYYYKWQLDFYNSDIKLEFRWPLDPFSWLLKPNFYHLTPATIYDPPTSWPFDLIDH